MNNTSQDLTDIYIARGATRSEQRDTLDYDKTIKLCEKTRLEKQPNAINQPSISRLA